MMEKMMRLMRHSILTGSLPSYTIDLPLDTIRISVEHSGISCGLLCRNAESQARIRTYWLVEDVTFLSQALSDTVQDFDGGANTHFCSDMQSSNRAEVRVIGRFNISVVKSVVPRSLRDEPAVWRKVVDRG